MYHTLSSVDQSYLNNETLSKNFLIIIDQIKKNTLLFYGYKYSAEMVFSIKRKV